MLFGQFIIVHRVHLNGCWQNVIESVYGVVLIENTQQLGTLMLLGTESAFLPLHGTSLLRDGLIDSCCAVSVESRYSQICTIQGEQLAEPSFFPSSHSEGDPRLNPWKASFCSLTVKPSIWHKQQLIWV